jgi:hypothetical protein
MRTGFESHFRKFPLRLEPAALEVKGKCANHFATEYILRTAKIDDKA